MVGRVKNSASRVTSDTRLSLEKLRKLIDEIHLETGLEFSEVIEQVKRLHHSVPVSAFSPALTVLEAAILYMKEHRNMRTASIAASLQRDAREVHTIYSRARQKTKALPEEEPGLRIPFSVFKKGRLSPLEAVVSHLRAQGLTFREIGRLLGKNERTVWTAWHRAEGKP